jgi:NTP pyrophosphatase (non-canonical NTP hydrolase)
LSQPFGQTLVDLCAPALDTLATVQHAVCRESGWYDDSNINDGTRVALMHSELSELLEALRRGDTKIDEHCPEFKNSEIELADLLLRAFDFAGYKGYRLGDALIAKFNYNLQRADHKSENRAKDGGKKF